ncbi:MAG: acylphosphatase [Nitrospirae bacterium]|nr:acylphosphatase [Nitrospirota bacterium]
MKTRVHLFINGIVQGVFFRDSAKQVAQSLGITGFVKNLPDGRVELVAEGEKDSVDKLVQWCRKGPPAAIVESVEANPEPYNDEFELFDVKRSR